MKLLSSHDENLVLVDGSDGVVRANNLCQDEHHDASRHHPFILPKKKRRNDHKTNDDDTDIDEEETASLSSSFGWEDFPLILGFTQHENYWHNHHHHHFEDDKKNTTHEEEAGMLLCERLFVLPAQPSQQQQQDQQIGMHHAAGARKQQQLSLSEEQFPQWTSSDRIGESTRQQQDEAEGDGDEHIITTTATFGWGDFPLILDIPYSNNYDHDQQSSWNERSTSFLMIDESASILSPLQRSFSIPTTSSSSDEDDDHYHSESLNINATPNAPGAVLPTKELCPVKLSQCSLSLSSSLLFTSCSSSKTTTSHSNTTTTTETATTTTRVSFCEIAVVVQYE